MPAFPPAREAPAEDAGDEEEEDDEEEGAFGGSGAITPSLSALWQVTCMDAAQPEALQTAASESCIALSRCGAAADGGLLGAGLTDHPHRPHLPPPMFRRRGRRTRPC